MTQGERVARGWRRAGMRTLSRIFLMVLAGALVSMLALVGVAHAAPAGPQEEVVTVGQGQKVALKTVLDKRTPYLVVVSGVITLTTSDGQMTMFDPFHSWFVGREVQTCESGRSGAYFEIKDAAGRTVGPFGHLFGGGTGVPACGADHRYEFRVNKSYPTSWDLDGKATISVPGMRMSNETVSGVFTFKIEPQASTGPTPPTVRPQIGVQTSYAAPKPLKPLTLKLPSLGTNVRSATATLSRSRGKGLKVFDPSFTFGVAPSAENSRAANRLCLIFVLTGIVEGLGGAHWGTCQAVVANILQRAEERRKHPHASARSAAARRCWVVIRSSSSAAVAPYQRVRTIA